MKTFSSGISSRCCSPKPHFDSGNGTISGVNQQVKGTDLRRIVTTINPQLQIQVGRITQSSAPIALIIFVLTYMRRIISIRERVVSVIPTAAIVGAFVSASGFVVLYVQPIMSDE